jgi:hypothetical protein
VINGCTTKSSQMIDFSHYPPTKSKEHAIYSNKLARSRKQVILVEIDSPWLIQYIVIKRD